MSQNQPVYVSLEFTPNPNTLKYAVNVELLAKGAKNFNVPADAKNVSPLVEKIFEIAGISGVMVGKDFITVTKSDDGDWDIVHKHTSSLIQKWLSEGNPVFTADALEQLTGTNHQAGSGSELEQKIKDILDKEIRPAVAMDGGDISFDRFDNGVVFLQMKGSCAGCPSSTMTLKMGIETRLKKAVPEVREVVSV